MTTPLLGNAYGFDRDVLLYQLQLVGLDRAADLAQRISAPPTLTRTIDGASTLDVTVDDHRRDLLRSGVLNARCWALVDDLTFELVSVRKTGDSLSLQFEDSIVAALRRRKGALSIKAGVTTRTAVAQQLAVEAGVPVLAEQTPRGLLNRSVERDDTTSTWELLGTLAEEAGWRRFSDGRTLLFGSDGWLAGLVSPLTVHEFGGPVQGIDWDLDVGIEASAATLAVDARLWAVQPGRAVTVLDQGPASGLWLAESFTRTLTKQRASVKLTRRLPVLPEPPPAAPPAQSDAGEQDLVPAQAAPAPRPPAGNSGRDRMVTFALGKRGLPYIWGGKTSRGYDCSGLVAAASAAGGSQLAGGSKQQWATCRSRGKVISVPEALRTRGAILFRMSGDPTHIAISLGDGSTIEARGRAYGVNVFGGAARRTWTGGALWL